MIISAGLPNSSKNEFTWKTLDSLFQEWQVPDDDVIHKHILRYLVLSVIEFCVILFFFKSTDCSNCTMCVIYATEIVNFVQNYIYFTNLVTLLNFIYQR